MQNVPAPEAFAEAPAPEDAQFVICAHLRDALHRAENGDFRHLYLHMARADGKEILITVAEASAE